MPCYIGYDKNGNQMHLCGNFGPHCAECAWIAESLCDFPVGEGKTCDRMLCHQHSNPVSQGIDYCTAHYKKWLEFKKAGGVEKKLGLTIRGFST